MRELLHKSPELPSVISTTVLETALTYCDWGWSIVPLRGKRPMVAWQHLQQQAASKAQVLAWSRAGLLQNVGVVCGAASHGLVVLDVDSEAGYEALRLTFPHLVNTYTVRTGSGHGYHVYWMVDQLPRTRRIRSPTYGGVELLATGAQVVAPPSVHPETGNTYRVARTCPLLKCSNLNDIEQWLQQFRTISPPHRPMNRFSAQSHTRSPRAETRNALVTYFEQMRYRRYGDWLNGRCVFPSQHRHGDAHPSFGFNTCSGFGYCFVCGALSPDVLCQALNILM